MTLDISLTIPEFLSFNTLSAYVGENGPLFVKVTA